MAHKGVLTLYDKDGKKYKTLKVNNQPLPKRNLFYKQKETADMLNEGIITEEEAWEQFAENIKNYEKKL